MKAVWGLVMFYAALLLTSQTSDSTEVTESTTIRDGLSTEENDQDNITSVTNSSDSARTDTTTITTMPAPRPPVYSAGKLSASEFRSIRQIQSYIYLTIEPVAVVLMVLSAMAFLRDRQFASNCYLAAVCLFEAWYLLMFLSNYLCRMHGGCFTSRVYVQVSIWTLSYSGMSAKRCVYVLNALTSVQRFTAIAFPLKVRRYRLLHQPRILLAVVFICCFSLHLYRPLQYTPVLLKDGKGNNWATGFSSLFKDHKKAFVALADLARYLMMYTPMLVCLVSNCLLIVALRRHNKYLSRINETNANTEQKDAAKSKSERQMTVTILVSTFLMLFFNTPININEAVSMYSDHYGILKRERYLYLVLRSAFSIVSQVSDFLIALSYFVLSTAFRRRFFALLGPVRHVAVCCHHRPAAAHTASDTSGAATAAVHSITQITTLTQTSGAEE